MKAKLFTISFMFLVSSFLVSNSAHAQGWSGQGEAGFVSASGNTDSENLNIGLKFTNAGPVWTHDLAFFAYTSSADGVDTAESYSVDYTAKRALSERSFIFGTLGFLDDDFDGFTEQLNVGVGYGYKIIDTEPVGWETGIGIGYRDTQQLIVLDDGTEIEGEDVSSATLILRSDYRNQLTANTQFLDVFQADIGADNTFIQNEAAIVVAMNESFSLKAGFIIRHNTDPPAGADDTDTITSLNLVYDFGG